MLDKALQQCYNYKNNYSLYLSGQKYRIVLGKHI